MNAWSMRGGASADAGLCKAEEVFVTLGAEMSKSDIIVFAPLRTTDSTRCCSSMGGVHLENGQGLVGLRDTGGMK